jgi:hypothetical protein
VAPSSAEAAKLWVSYLSGWTAWNHVRTTASLAAAALLTIAYRLSPIAFVRRRRSWRRGVDAY